MKITKIGHCCLLIEVDGKRIMTDPGGFTVSEHMLDDIDVIVYTHEHGDHFHLDSLKALIVKNPAVSVVTNTGVGKLLTEAGIEFTLLEGTDAATIADIAFEACDARHVEIFEQYGQVQNTGFFIAQRLFYPGDAYAEPGKPIDILALPVGGPWCKLADAIHYVLRVQPKNAFPVHDGLSTETGLDIHHRVVGDNLADSKVAFHPMRAGDSAEF